MKTAGRKHEHDFRWHVILPTSFGVMAWVPWYAVYDTEKHAGRGGWQCIKCQEQGYEIPEAAG